MALSGNFTVKCKTSGYTDKYIKFVWSATQNVSANTSTISWKLLGGDPDGGYVKAGGFYVNIDGGDPECNYITDYRVKMYTDTVLASGTKTITHDEKNGTKSFTVEVNAGIFNYARNTNGSTTFTLDTIPRKSTLDASNGTLGTEQTLTINTASSSFYHRIAYACGTVTQQYIKVNNTDKLVNVTSVPFTPPLSLAAQNTTGTSVSVTFTLYTFAADGTHIGSTTKTVSMAIPASVAPSCSLAVSDAAGHYSTYSAYIKGLSKLSVTVTPTLSHGSPIASYSTTANGATYTAASFTTDALKTSGTLSVSTTVKDKRGRTGTATKSISVLDYAAPSVTKLTVQRWSAASGGSANEQGAYVKVTFSASVTSLSNQNTAAYKLRYKKSTVTSWTEYTFANLANNYAPADQTYIFAADTGASYDVQLVAADRHLSDTKTTSASTAFTIMHFKSDGTAMAIGKVAETPNSFEVGLDAHLNKNVHVGGQVLTSFKSAVAMGSYNAVSSTIPDLVNEVRYSSGVMGSVSIGTAYTSGSVTIAAGWYNFIYSPHRSGGANGAASGDNCNYGTLLLYGMTIANAHYRIRVASGNISEVARVIDTSYVGEINGTNEYLSGSLYVGGKKSTTDGKAGVAFGASGNITMQNASEPKMTFIVGSGTSQQGTVSLNADGWMKIAVSDTTLVLRKAAASTAVFGLTTDDTHYLGASITRWKAVYATTGTVSTSDRNQKENIKDIDAKYIKMFDLLQPVSYEFIGKEHDRVHLGFISQDVKAAMDEAGLSDLDYAGYCRDVKTVFDEETQTDVPVLDENGDPVYMYSLRYDEFIALNTKMIQMNRKKIAEQEEKIAKQQEEIDKLKKAIEKILEGE